MGKFLYNALKQFSNEGSKGLAEACLCFVCLFEAYPEISIPFPITTASSLSASSSSDFFVPFQVLVDVPFRSHSFGVRKPCANPTPAPHQLLSLYASDGPLASARLLVLMGSRPQSPPVGQKPFGQ